MGCRVVKEPGLAHRALEEVASDVSAGTQQPEESVIVAEPHTLRITGGARPRTGLPGIGQAPAAPHHRGRHATGEGDMPKVSVVRSRERDDGGRSAGRLCGPFGRHKAHEDGRVKSAMKVAAVLRKFCLYPVSHGTVGKCGRPSDGSWCRLEPSRCPKCACFCVPRQSAMVVDRRVSASGLGP